MLRIEFILEIELENDSEFYWPEMGNRIVRVKSVMG
jgi:hypothetical protein